MYSDVSIIIPAFNEEQNIQKTLILLKENCPDAEVIVIDDGSSDTTAASANQVPGIKLIQHAYNKGYVASLKTGMRKSTRPIIVWFDADGQHRVEDMNAIIEPIRSQGMDATFGRRTKESAFVVRRVPGKWLLKLVSQIIARQKIPDLNCGFRAFRRDIILRYLHLLPDGFSASATTTLLMLKRNYMTAFVPVMSPKRVGSSTVRMFRDGFRTLSIMFRIMLLFDAFLFFTFFALLQILPAISYSIYMAITYRLGIPVLGSLVIISGTLTFFMGIISSQISQMRQERFESKEVS